TYPGVAPWPAAVALVPVLGVVDAPAVAFPPPLVKCTTRKTIRTTAMTDAAREAIMRIPPKRRDDGGSESGPAGPERGGRPREAKSSPPEPRSPGASMSGRT